MGFEVPDQVPERSRWKALAAVSPQMPLGGTQSLRHGEARVFKGAGWSDFETGEGHEPGSENTAHQNGRAARVHRALGSSLCSPETFTEVVKGGSRHADAYG